MWGGKWVPHPPPSVGISSPDIVDADIFVTEFIGGRRPDCLQRSSALTTKPEKNLTEKPVTT